MRTIREESSGTMTLRLVETGRAFAGIVIKGGEIKVRESGEDAENVWRRLVEAAASLAPPPATPRKARTLLRKATLGDLTLRLEKTDSVIIGRALEGKEVRLQEEGQDPDDVWRRLHDERYVSNERD